MVVAVPRGWGGEERGVHRGRAAAAGLELVGHGQGALHERVVCAVLLLLVRPRRRCRARELAEGGEGVRRGGLLLLRCILEGGRGGGGLACGGGGGDETLQTVLPVTIWADESVVLCGNVSMGD